MASAPIVLANASSLDLLAVIPGGIGFQPRDSLVVCALHPPRGRLGMMVRLDRAALTVAEGLTVTRNAVERMRALGAGAVFVARYAADGAPRPAQDGPFLQVLDEISSVLPIRGLWSVGDDTLEELSPADAQPVGQRYTAEDLKGSRGAAALAFGGVAVRERREDLAVIGLTSREERRLARSAEGRAWDRSLGLAGDDLGQWRAAGLGLWRKWLGKLGRDAATVAPSSACGRMHALIRDAQGRDAVLATAFKNAGKAPQRLALGRGGFEILDPLTSPGLDGAVAPVALNLLSRIISHLPPRRRGAGYALGAAWHWWDGASPAAAEWARSSMDCLDPPELAWLINSLITRGIYPAATQGLIPAPAAPGPRPARRPNR